MRTLWQALYMGICFGRHCVYKKHFLSDTACRYECMAITVWLCVQINGVCVVCLSTKAYVVYVCMHVWYV